MLKILETSLTKFLFLYLVKAAKCRALIKKIFIRSARSQLSITLSVGDVATPEMVLDTVCTSD